MDPSRGRLAGGVLSKFLLKISIKQAFRPLIPRLSRNWRTDCTQARKGSATALPQLDTYGSRGDPELVFLLGSYALAGLLFCVLSGTSSTPSTAPRTVVFFFLRAPSRPPSRARML